MKEELEDQQWIDALSGKAAGNQTASAAETQAGVLRKIIMRQIEARPIYEPSPARFEMLLGEAKKQGLLKPEKTAWRPSDLISRIYQLLAMPASVMASVTIVLGLSITTGWQAQQLKDLESETVRSGTVSRNVVGPSVTQLVAADLEVAQKAQRWQQDLLAKRIEHAVSFEAPTRILIRIRLTPDAVELLQAERMTPPSGDWYTVIIATAQAKP